MNKFLLVALMLIGVNSSANINNKNVIINYFNNKSAESKLAFLIGCMSAYNLPSEDVNQSIIENNYNNTHDSYGIRHLTKMILIKAGIATFFGTSCYFGLKTARNIFNFVK